MTSIPTTYNYNNDVQKFRYLERIDTSPVIHDKNVKADADKFMLRRNRLSRKETTTDKLQALGGALLGTALSMALLMKKQKIKNPLKLKYELPEMLLMSGAPIIGGVAVGMIGNDKETNLAKSKEGGFQFLIAAIPTWLAAGTLKWCETTKGFNNPLAKLVSIAGTILVGMHGAAA